MIFGVISYEYILHFEKEVKFVWTRQWSMMTYLYLITRYFGIFLAMLSACWGGLLYIPDRACKYTVFNLNYIRLPRSGNRLRSCCSIGVGFFSFFLVCGSYPHLASLRSIQPIQVSAVCADWVVPNYRRALGRDGYILV
jgi:hypothetical protein